MRALNILNPGMIQVDMGLSRIFRVRERQTVQFRWEVFNVPNRLNAAAPNTTLNSGSFGQTDWPTFGHDPAGTRFSLLRQINPGNVRSLERAWTYHMRGGEGGGVYEVSPLVVNGVMYLTTSGSKVVALEPETGKEIWSYRVTGGQPAPRGLEYWGGDKQAPAEVFFGTSDGRLIALNAVTGRPVPGFGNEGFVDLKKDAQNGFGNSPFGLSSPPIIYKNVVITGAHVQETPSLGSSGDTRAWDIHTGKLVWRFHSIPFPILVDPGQKMGELYQTRGLMVKRTVYLIGPDGRIRYGKRGMPDPDEVLSHAS